MLQYRDLISDVRTRIGVSTEEARAAADAVIGAVARTVEPAARDRLLATVPGSIALATPDAPGAAPTADALVSAVSWLTGAAPEQARYRAQAVLATVADHEPDLIDALHLPDDIRSLCADPAAGGGVTGPTGHSAPLTRDEVVAALTGLPGWTGDTRALRRTLTLPAGNLDRVLDRVARLHRDLGRGPGVTRDGDTAVFTVCTSAIGAVTAADVDLAHRVDATIAAASPGMA
jgi:pterin-4a-carbinolamine dehydratase